MHVQSLAAAVWGTGCWDRSRVVTGRGSFIFQRERPGRDYKLDGAELKRMLYKIRTVALESVRQRHLAPAACDDALALQCAQQWAQAKLWNLHPVALFHLFHDVA